MGEEEAEMRMGEGKKEVGENSIEAIPSQLMTKLTYN